jgi:UDP-galactopyranose mutase
MTCSNLFTKLLIGNKTPIENESSLYKKAKMKKALVIGGGIAGCASAQQFALKGGWDVTLIEAGNFLGAGVRTQWWGGHPYTFGPRHFLTQNEKVFNFFNKYCPIRLTPEHEFITYVEQDNQFYNFPINKSDVAKMPDRDEIDQQLTSISGVINAKNLEDYWIGSVGKILYHKFIDQYSKKMWQVGDNREIDTFSWSPKGVALKDGPKAAWDNAYSGYPYAPNGYDDYFALSTGGARVQLNTRIEQYDIVNKRVKLRGDWHKFDVIVNTISPDTLFDFQFGELPFIGRDFHKIVLPSEFAFPPNVYFIYYANAEQFTRLVEYKKFTKHKAPNTLIGMEIPSRNGKHYPLPISSEIERAERYLSLLPEGVFSIGRAGTYLYRVDIDDCIEQALDIGEKI